MTGAAAGSPSPRGEWIRDLTIFAALFFVGFAAHYFLTIDWSGPIPRDSHGFVVGRDFLNFWMYGRAAFMEDPGRFYDVAVYNREIATSLGFESIWVNWSYPPSIMLIASPFAWMSYLPALLIWTALGLFVFLWFAWRHTSDLRIPLILVLSPAAVLCLVSGQHSLFTTAMMIGAFAWLDRRPALAGILIGLLTLKPQLGLLFPFMLAASGRWRVFGTAAITAVAVAAVTAALFGPKIWLDYLMLGIPTQNKVLLDPRMMSAPYMPTIFMNLRMAGASYQLAMAIQACSAAAAVAAVVWAFRYRKHSEPLTLAALFFACSIFATGYVLSYDTLPLTFCAVLLAASGQLTSLGNRLAQLVYWMPAIQLVLGELRVPGAALIVPAFALYLVLRLKAGASSRIADMRAAA